MNDIDTYLEASGARASSNNEWVLDCPFCLKPGHLYVNSEPGEGKTGRDLPAGRWICFRCGKRGMTMAYLIAELEGITLQKARAIMARWKLGTVKWHREVFKETQQPDGDWLPAEFEPVFDGKRWLWPRYLDGRTTREVAAKMGLGVCRSGEYAHRIILPIVCPAGCSFTARTIWPDETLRYKAGPGAGRLLFGWSTIDGAAKAGVVEGPFDALRVIEAGLPCVALMGKQLRDSQFEMLKQRRTDYVVMLDPDAVEESADIAQRLGGRVALGLTNDPGDSALHVIQEAFGSAVEPDDATMLVYMARNQAAGMGKRPV